MKNNRFYMIALAEHGDNIVGARLINTRTGKVVDRNISELKMILGTPGRVYNLGLSEGKIVGTQGVLDRYPKIKSNNTVENKDNIIAISKNEDGIYNVVNLRGSVANIPEDQLIQYGKKHTISNCKIVKRGDGKEHISAIRGDIETIDTENRFEYDKENGELTVYIGNMGTKELAVPKWVKGVRVTDVQNLMIIPSGIANRITGITFPETIETLGEQAISRLYNLRKLAILGRIKGLNNRVFRHNPKITHIYIDSMDDSGWGRGTQWFRGMNTLRKLNMRVRPSVVERMGYSGCINLKQEQMIYPGIRRIEFGAFEDCRQLKHVEIPSTVKHLARNAFRGCTNIKTMRINSSETDLVNDRYNNITGVTDIRGSSTLLGTSQDATLYVPSDYPQSILDEHVHCTVKIVREGEQNSGNKEQRNKIKKARIIGNRIKEDDIAQTVEEALGFLAIVEEKEWRRSIISIIRDTLNGYMAYNERRLVNSKGSYIGVNAKGIAWGSGRLRKAEIGDNIAYAQYNAKVVAIPISVGLISKIIRNTDRTIFKENGNESVLEILPKSLFISSSSIKNIKEDGHKLIIQKRNGETEEITF